MCHVSLLPKWRSFVILLFRLSFFTPPFPLPLLSTKELLCRHGDDRAAPKKNLEYYAFLTARSRASGQHQSHGLLCLMATSSLSWRRGQLGRSKVIRNWEDKAQRVLLNLLLQCALSMVMKGQRDGEPSCSSPDCMSTMYHQQPVSCLIPVVSRLIHRYQTRYPVSCLVSDLVPGIWVSWLGVRPGTRRYQAWYLVSGYHGWYSHVSDLVLRYQG
uniref:Secreted protein n=1 Tax=Oryza barthii TaxID=65489 RepID=A0A0D3FIT2_9ORYZ